MNKQYSGTGEIAEKNVDVVFMDTLAECYRAACGWEVRRPILSIMADKRSLAQIRKWIPELSHRCFTEAKRHCLVYGRGQPIQSLSPRRRTVLSTDKIEHFFSFITSPQVIQELPFGEKTIKLSTNNQIKMPNVVRMITTREDYSAVSSLLSGTGISSFKSQRSAPNTGRVFSVCNEIPSRARLFQCRWCSGI